MTILLLHKVDFRARNITKGQKETLCNDKSINSQRYNNPKCLVVSNVKEQPQSFKIYKAKIDNSEENRQIQNNKGFNTPLKYPWKKLTENKNLEDLNNFIKHLS